MKGLSLNVYDVKYKEMLLKKLKVIYFYLGLFLKWADVKI